MLCASRGLRQHRWERPGWTVDAEQVSRWAHSEWIDLRLANAALWRERAQKILAKQAGEAASGISSSQLNRRFKSGAFDIGEIAAWIFIDEDEGARI